MHQQSETPPGATGGAKGIELKWDNIPSTPQRPLQVRIIDLSKIEGNDSLWTVTLAGVDEPITVTVTNGTLQTFKRFRDPVIRERGVILERLTSREWWRMVDSAMYVFLHGGRK
jgi:hypothetical protein